MLISAELMRLLLAACLVSLAGLAILSLRRRGLSTAELIGWGMLAVLLPLIGPFLVISCRPGKKIIPSA